MNDRPPASPKSDPFPSTPPTFAPWTTTLFAVAWALVMIQGWGGLILGEADSWLNDPVSAASRIATRELELAEAAQSDVGAVGWVREHLYGDVSESRLYAIEIFEELILNHEVRAETDLAMRGNLDRSRIQLAILYAEDGQLDAALATAEAIPAGEEFVALLSALYADEGSGSFDPEAGTPFDMLAEAGAEGWLLDRPAIRLFEKADSADQAGRLEATLLERGQRWLAGSESLVVANWTLIFFGAAIVIREAVNRRRNRQVWFPPSAPPPWSLADGLGVLIRGDFWGRVYFVALGSAPLEFQLSPLGDALYAWGTPISSIPLVWLTMRHLIRPHRETALSCFGLRPRGRESATLFAVFLSALAIDLLGTSALSWASVELGFHGHWAEGFDETLVWGTIPEALRIGLDYLVWAPIVEEFTFRGLLYFTLRQRLDPWSAAIASAGIFGIVHFYSLPGFLTTFWSGFIWALAFERSRSLIPGIAAHAVYNLFYVAGQLLIYR